MLIRKRLQSDLYIIFIFQSVFQNVELQYTNDTDNDLFQTGVKLFEDLDRTFLRDLRHALNKLLSLHGIQLSDTCKMLRCKGRDTCILKIILWHTERIADRENTRIKDAYNITRIGFVQNFSGICHDLLRLGKTHDLSALHMLHFHACIKAAGADTHKCHAVSVCLIHIRLNLEHKSRKFIFHRIDRSFIRNTRKRCCSHFQKVL